MVGFSNGLAVKSLESDHIVTAVMLLFLLGGTVKVQFQRRPPVFIQHAKFTGPRRIKGLQDKTIDSKLPSYAI